MLKLINPGYYFPSSFLVDKTKYFEPGTLAMINNNIAKISNGSQVDGIIDDIYNDVDDSTFASNRVTVWPLKKYLQFQTDQFEQGIQASDRLYVRDGKFTNTPNFRPIAICKGFQSFYLHPASTKPTMSIIAELL